MSGNIAGYNRQINITMIFLSSFIQICKYDIPYIMLTVPIIVCRFFYLFVKNKKCIIILLYNQNNSSKYYIRLTSPIHIFLLYTHIYSSKSFNRLQHVIHYGRVNIVYVFKKIIMIWKVYFWWFFEIITTALSFNFLAKRHGNKSLNNS